MTDARAIVLYELWWHGEAWRHPDVCDAGQKGWLAAVRADVDAGRQASHVWRVSRQRGKSHAALAFALCEMARRPGIIVRYAALTGKSCAAIVLPTLRWMTERMPYQLDVREHLGTVRHPNGSELVFAGTDNEQFERLRGPRAHVILLDESAFYSDLEAVERALLPQLTTTSGVVVYLSTPPEASSHPFVLRDSAAQASGRWVRETIRGNPRLGPEGVAAIERAESQRLGLTVEALRASTYWRREYLAEMVTEEGRAAVPAWTDEARAELVREWQRPAHFDAYVGLDPGKYGDPHATLFAWHDPATNTVTFEDELELRSATTHVGAWAQAIKDRESALWGVNRWEGTLSGATRQWLEANRLDELFLRVHSETAPRQPFLRVSDDDPRTTVDMAMQHGVAALPSARHEKWAWVDTLNQLVRERRFRVHPRCVRLLEQLRSTLWNRSRSEWERTPRDHGDLLDCAIYIVRNVVWARDCRPAPVVDTGLVRAQEMVRGPKTGLGTLLRLR